MVGAVLSLVTPTIRNSITSLIPHEVGKYELHCARACYHALENSSECT
jgi:hypothetical protein